MPSPEIEEFAKILVQKVRDAAIRSCDSIIQSSADAPIVNRWRESSRHDTPEALAKLLIPDIVDESISQLLLAIDQEVLQLSFRNSNGKLADLTNEGLGELCGWYMGSSGWRAMYAKERFVDDFADLAEWE